MNQSGTNDYDSDTRLARERALQDAAERAERSGLATGDPEVDAYRLVLRGIRDVKMPEIPTDFAQSTVHRLQARERSERVERILTQVLIGLLALVGAVLALPKTLAAIEALAHHNVDASLQWPLLLSAVLALA